MDDADAGPQSLFVLVSYEHKAQFFSSILQLDPKNVNEHKYVAHFEHPPGYPPIKWVFSRLESSTEDLCFVPDWSPIVYEEPDVLHGFIYNVRTQEAKSIKPPRGSVLYKHVVALGGLIFFMGIPCYSYDVPIAFFWRYNCLKDMWQPLESFPYFSANKHRSDGCIGGIVASAVWNDTILLNMDGCGMWAYAVSKNKWYPVVDEGNLCDVIVGKAVVLGNTFYFLTNVFELVVALTIKRKAINDDLVFECSQGLKITVPGVNEIKFEQENTWWRTRDLVQLGKDNLCIVRSRNTYGCIEYQPIQLTSIELKGNNSMTVTDTCVHAIKLLQNMQFEVQLCFTLPEYKTTALKGIQNSVLDPFPDSFEPKPVQEEEIVTLHNVSSHIGHSIHIKKLPPNVTVRQLEEGVKKFGPIKRDGIQLRKNKKGEFFAYVEFENGTSKQRAIEACGLSF